MCLFFVSVDWCMCVCVFASLPVLHYIFVQSEIGMSLFNYFCLTVFVDCSDDTCAHIKRARVELKKLCDKVNSQVGLLLI